MKPHLEHSEGVFSRYSIPSITTKSLPQMVDLQALKFRICVGATESAQHDFHRTPL
jgi:hypothetical protein